jgi:hypothetical protein
MTATTFAASRQSALQPQLSAVVRFAAAVAVAAVLAGAWVVAAGASHLAVQSAAAAFSGETPQAVPVLRAAAAQAHSQRSRTGA